MSKKARTQSDVISQVSEFLARYLQCSEHQRTVLALWVLHTYCSSAAQVTPYLSIQSAYKQSGKTLCLQLLSLLCDNPALTAGFTASNLALRMRLRPVSTVLLDECQATLGTRARSRAPALRALLASGYHRGLGYTGAVEERSVFCPKAFAGMGQLPEALADRSIPIILEPLGHVNHSVVSSDDQMTVACPRGELAEPKEPDDPMVERFHLVRATQEAEPLKQQLRAWAEKNLPQLTEMPPYSEDEFPPKLSPRRRDMTEPLLQLADAVGGQWPARTRQALAGVFEEETNFDLQSSLQVLADLHHCFFYHGFPERLSTAVLLDWMHTLPARSWDVDGLLSARNLACLLAAFDIRPRLQRIGPARPARGYALHDFLEPWRRHLGFAGPYPTLGRSSLSPAESPGAPWAEGPPWQVTSDLSPGIVTDEHQSEIASKDAGCNGITDVGAVAAAFPITRSPDHARSPDLRR